MYYHRGICTVGAIDFLQKVDTNWLLAMLTKPLLLVVTSCTCEQVGWRDYQKYTIVLGREFVSSADVFHLESGGLGTTTDHWNTSTGSGGYACAAVGDDLHHIGGHCGHRSCYHNGVHKLSTSSLQWVMLSPTSPPHQKMTAGHQWRKLTVVWRHSRIRRKTCILFVVGGSGTTPSSRQPRAQYKKYLAVVWGPMNSTCSYWAQGSFTVYTHQCVIKCTLSQTHPYISSSYMYHNMYYLRNAHIARL